MIATIARKELTEMIRDGRFRLVGIAIFGLLLVALAFGWRQTSAVRAERAAAQDIADHHWEEQDEKNPHMAAHYGLYVFKPTGVLSFVDPGVEPHVGVAMKLQAHRQNLSQHAEAQDGTGMQWFGRLSVGSVLQLLFPLLIIAIAFSAWTSERESGTLRQVASLGVTPRALLFGKALGLALALTLLLVPAAVAGGVTVLVLGGESETPGGAGARLAWMGGAYLLYFAIYVALALFVSAVAPSSRFALVALVGFWVVTALVAPRAATDVAASSGGIPSAAELAANVRKSLDGPDREARVNALSEQLLEKYGFSGAETLMDESLLAGIELQAEAAFENEVIDVHFGRLWDALERQERTVQWASVLSPFLAIRSLSMGLAGTDFSHHRDFVAAAEQHRRAMVALLNDDFAKNGGEAGWSYKAGRDLWERAPPFEFTQITALEALRRYGPSAASLLVWLLLAALAARVAVGRMRVS